MGRSAQVFRSVMRNGSFRRVLAGFFLFNAQEYAVWIAVIVYAFERGGTATAGIVLVAQLVPAALVAPFTSVLGDRLRRDTALSLGYLIQAARARLLAIALWNGATAVGVRGRRAVELRGDVHAPRALRDPAGARGHPGAADRRQRRDRHDGRAGHRSWGRALRALIVSIETGGRRRR